MADEDDAYFKRVVKTIERAAADERSLLSALDLGSLRDVNESVEKLARLYSNGVDGAPAVRRQLVTYLGMCSLLVSELSGEAKAQTRRLELLEDETRHKERVERSEAWKSYRDSSIRWVVSALIVFVAYSTAIWMSDHYPFFKVPVHDLLKEKLDADAADMKRGH